MEILVTIDEIKRLLQEAKRQFISVALSNKSGQWSNAYFQLEEIKNFRAGGQTMTILLLCATDSTRTMVDARLIHSIKFDKFLQLDGCLVDAIKIVSKDTALQYSHQK